MIWRPGRTMFSVLLCLLAGTLQSPATAEEVSPWDRSVAKAAVRDDEHDHPAALALELIASGLDRALGFAHPGDGSGRLFVARQSGQIHELRGSVLQPAPFLDISGRVKCCSSERGLVGLAFHPDFATNGYFYVSYVARNGDSVVSRFSVATDGRRGDPGSEVEILRVEQPFPNHNVNHVVFGPDGYLWVGAGDGGSGGDPLKNGQNLETLLGKILRLDVDGGTPYAIPPDNPFVGTPGAREEIWAYGLRNPWRFSFDRRKGDLYIADVGQNQFEELDFEPAGSGGGRNYGWSVMEGPICRDGVEDCNDGTLALPIHAYAHEHGHDGEDEGCNSVTGGFRYRGPAVPTLPRFYVFGDFCTGQIWGARSNLAGAWQVNELMESGLLITAFGEDQQGNLYLAHFRGDIYRIVGKHLFADDFESGGTAGWSQRAGVLAVDEPGLGGTSRALEVAVDGTASRRFLRSNEPAGETTFEAGFLLKVDQVDLRGGEVDVLHLKGKRVHLRLTLRQQGRKYWAGLYARGNRGGYRFLGETRVPARRAVRLAVDWMRATGPEAADGQVLLRKDGKVVAGADDLQNDALTVETLLLGLPRGSRGTGSGAFLIDEFVSNP